jgi:hypothetical protein
MPCGLRMIFVYKWQSLVYQSESFCQCMLPWLDYGRRAEYNESESVVGRENFIGSLCPIKRYMQFQFEYWTSDSNLRLSWSNCRAGYSTANGRYSFISVGWCGMDAVGYLIWMIYRVFFYISNLLWWKYRGFLKKSNLHTLFSCTCNIKRVYETLPLCQIISGPDL